MNKAIYIFNEQGQMITQVFGLKAAALRLGVCVSTIHLAIRNKKMVKNHVCAHTPQVRLYEYEKPIKRKKKGLVKRPKKNELLYQCHADPITMFKTY